MEELQNPFQLSQWMNPWTFPLHKHHKKTEKGIVPWIKEPDGGLGPNINQRPPLECGTQPLWASWVAQLIKNLPAMLETPVGFLGWEVSLERG